MVRQSYPVVPTHGDYPASAAAPDGTVHTRTRSTNRRNVYSVLLCSASDGA